MHFIEQLLAADRQAFFMVNRGLACSLLDHIMPIVRNQWTWVPVYAFFAVFLVHNFKQKGFYVILFAGLTFFLSDQISAHVLKFIVQRPRPCNDGQIADMVRLLVPCGGGFSFPSSHATNHFAFSVFIISVMPLRARWVVPFAITWAALVSFAQVYVGVHYPLDVSCGALLGAMIGFTTGQICIKALRLNWDRTEDEDEIIENEPEEE
jgi:undecaprenyl-diphosphatase